LFMKIGMIVYSKTGNTNLVAERVKDALISHGHEVSLHRFSAETEAPQSNKAIRLTANPDPNGYDLLIFGAPVQAFSLDPAMIMYVKQLSGLKPVPSAIFITQQLKKPWLGGNHATRQLIKLLQEKGLTSMSMGIANWSNPIRESQIASIVEKSCNFTEENNEKER